MYIHYEHEKATLYGKEFILMSGEHSVLLRRRKQLKLTQQQVADKARIQLRQYQRLESGERNISSSSGRIMLAVCEALYLDPYLFLGSGNEAPEVKYVVLPPIQTEGLCYAIPAEAYYAVVSAIPRGMVCTDDDVMKCLRSAYGMEGLEIKSDRNSVSLHTDRAFPYWRVVSQRGFLINSLYCSKERQRELLKVEGVSAAPVGENESYRVEDFAYRRFDFSNMRTTVLKTDAEILKQMTMR